MHLYDVSHHHQMAIAQLPMFWRFAYSIANVDYIYPHCKIKTTWRHKLCTTLKEIIQHKSKSSKETPLFVIGCVIVTSAALVPPILCQSLQSLVQKSSTLSLIIFAQKWLCTNQCQLIWTSYSFFQLQEITTFYLSS